MNSLVVVGASLALLFWAYRFYARKLERLWGVDPKRATPAFAKYDSVDYIPAKNWLVLFGHNFASIAGAGPIIGPVIAVMLWGWLPALIWVVLGTIFIGGVHDFGSLMASVREGGSSVADIAQHVVSRRAKLIFSLFVWLALILIIAVFAYFCADTFVKEPKIVLPSLGLIPVAMVVGYFLYHARMNSTIATVFGLACLTALIWLGNCVPIPGSMLVWLGVLFVYCFFASVLPVNILLQPRDYLSSFLLFFGVGAGYTGLLLSPTTMAMPPYHGWNASEGALWPALFITVACGAISGFHALVASGTTSKQLASERHAKRISYGGMIAEALVAILAIVGLASLFGRHDNFALLLGRIGPIELYGKSYGLITRKILGSYGPFIAITILNAFILTTLDTAARIARYLTEELFGVKNRYLSTVLILIISAALAISGEGRKIWQAFGAANQLMAALALFVLSCWLAARNAPRRFTLVPALFMFVTTVVALILQAASFLRQKDFILLAIVALLLVSSGFMIREVAVSLAMKGKTHA
ncbi:MAG TPA: carbon starvation protein A [Patescibacteria group bacterium]|nr:carbon starvation protein A [Patescibacteria group bacterium]